ncbi:microtubule-associated protein [Scheffersomyces stipitis CBS 6054]|uniref:Microtubule-associated protein n=1 Tax=Scheffersomyces stipitis (strain ATCC 58785 / CBS 6054 / NBRC 10063 / NRRL Y-11545) TaxID=322104 RepID=A3LY09_PICST|nr:microtubule-associated protein [Scheffersomyces stipitis CBS 6054]ABN67897.2 microtubule-associated protein [Scheffersomyces stipitis CBS 6054]
MSSKDVEASDSTSAFDLCKIRDILEKQASNLKGVQTSDVDWFLRDYSISAVGDRPDDQKSHSSNSKHRSNSTSASNASNVTETNSNASNISSNDTKKTVSNNSLSPVSSHLNTNISNTNGNNLHKTKPSIAPVQEENVLPIVAPESPVQRRDSTRRKSSVSSLGSTSSSSGGFFSKLKVKLGHNKPAKQPVFKSNYDMRMKKGTNDTNVNVGSSSPSFGPSVPSAKMNGTAESSFELARSSPNVEMASTDSFEESVDPRLEEYIKFYQQKDIRRSSVASRRSSVASASSASTTASIPSHPAISPLPSALVNGYDNVTYNKNVAESEPPSTTSKFSSFLRPPSVLDSDSNFKNLKPFKRVAFHSSTFLIDPPQQIPSRTPRKGNVEIIGTTVKINPLTDEDKLAMEKSQMGQGGGIVVGGTGALGLIKKDKDEEDEEDEEEVNGEPGSPESPKDGLIKNDSISSTEDEPAVDKKARALNIDKPMIHHQPAPAGYSIPVKKMALDLMYTRCCHLREILPIPAILKQIPKGSMAPLPVLQLRNPTPTMVEIQTFADFLRIAPVICVSLDGVSLSLEQFKILLAAMSAKKQLEKISLRNTPMDQEGWAMLCWFLSRNTVLNRLDITQCPSLSVNVLKKRKKRNSDAKKDEEVKRMTCNADNRSDMDWSLFVATLVARGGIEELILTGCCITDLDNFEKLMKLAVSKKTNRLGLAYNQLTPKHVKIVVDNWLFRDFARGLDLGYNDFSSIQMLKIFLDFKNEHKDFEELISKSMLAFLSLNSTNSMFNEYFKEVFESILLKLPNLKYLDFSNNQRLFGTFSKSPSVDSNSGIELHSDNSSISSSTSSSSSKDLGLSESAITQYFTSKLPLFPKLIRLHLENINFSQSSLLSIAKVMPFCKNLGYFSLLGNRIELTAASALINALKNSKTLIALDCDNDNFPDLFKERIGLYCMRNMERLLYASKSVDLDLNDSGNENAGESLTESMNKILSMKAKQKLDLTSPEVSKFIRRALKIRQELKATIDELLQLQLRNELDLEGKETLIRFIFIDSSIEKGLQLIDPSLTDVDNNILEQLANSAEDEKNLKKALFIQYDDQNLGVPKSNDIPPSISPLGMSRSTSRTNLSNLDRQEGSVLKLSRLHDFHHQHEEGYMGDVSGEDLRKKLRGVEFADLEKIISYLEELKNKGISLGKVYNMHGKNPHRQTLEPVSADGDRINEAYDKVLSTFAHK